MDELEKRRHIKAIKEGIFEVKNETQRSVSKISIEFNDGTKEELENALVISLVQDTEVEEIMKLILTSCNLTTENFNDMLNGLLQLAIKGSQE